MCSHAWRRCAGCRHSSAQRSKKILFRCAHVYFSSNAMNVYARSAPDVDSGSIIFLSKTVSLFSFVGLFAVRCFLRAPWSFIHSLFQPGILFSPEAAADTALPVSDISDKTHSAKRRAKNKSPVRNGIHALTDTGIDHAVPHPRIQHGYSALLQFSSRRRLLRRYARSSLHRRR